MSQLHLFKHKNDLKQKKFLYELIIWKGQQIWKFQEVALCILIILYLDTILKKLSICQYSHVLTAFEEKDLALIIRIYTWQLAPLAFTGYPGVKVPEFFFFIAGS
ncbi:hypothetical protein ACJX0J_025137, partial [Zea mays]